MTADSPTGLVLNIQHFCTHDGPGIRTTVFLKFCSLHCKWCSNPESIGQKPELAYNPSKCIGAKACGRCLKPPAPEGAMYVFFRIAGVSQSLEFCKQLVREARLGLAPGSAFGPEGEGFVRWCFAASEERLADGVGRLRSFLRR